MAPAQVFQDALENSASKFCDRSILIAHAGQSSTPFTCTTFERVCVVKRVSRWYLFVSFCCLLLSAMNKLRKNNCNRISTALSNGRCQITTYQLQDVKSTRTAVVDVAFILLCVTIDISSTSFSHV